MTYFFPLQTINLLRHVSKAARPDFSLGKGGEDENNLCPSPAAFTSILAWCDTIRLPPSL